jgi:hypothetical protein
MLAASGQGAEFDVQQLLPLGCWRAEAPTPQQMQSGTVHAVAAAAGDVARCWRMRVSECSCSALLQRGGVQLQQQTPGKRGPIKKTMAPQTMRAHVTIGCVSAVDSQRHRHKIADQLCCLLVA